MSANADASLAILGDVIARPAFPESEVKKVLSESLDPARSMKDNPRNAIRMYHDAFYFGAAHPYGQVADEVAMARVAREDITGYHKRMYTGKNLIAVVTGSFDPKVLGPKIVALAGSSACREAYGWAKASAPKFSGSRMLLIDKPDATSDVFPHCHAGHREDASRPGGADAGEYAVWRAVHIDAQRRAQGEFGIDLWGEFRGGRDRLTGGIYISTYTRTDAEKAMDMSLDLLKQLRERGSRRRCWIRPRPM